MVFVPLHPGALHVITGPGTIGRVVVNTLRDRGVPYLLTARMPPRQSEPAVSLDLSTMSSIRPAVEEIVRVAHGREIVLVHMAGGVDTSIRGAHWSTAGVFAANGLGPLALIELLEPHGLIRVIAASSDGVGLKYAVPSTKRITSPKQPVGVLRQYLTGKLVVDTYQANGQTPSLSVALPATRGNFFKGEPRIPKLIMRLGAGRTVTPDVSAGAILWALEQESTRGLVTVHPHSNPTYQLEKLWQRVDDPALQDWIEEQLSRFMAP